MFSWVDPAGILFGTALYFIYWDIKDTHQYGTRYTSTFSYALLLIMVTSVITIILSTVLGSFGVLNEYSVITTFILATAAFNIGTKHNQPFYIRLYGRYTGGYTRKSTGLPVELRIVNPSQQLWHSNESYIIDISESRALFIPFESEEDLDEFLLDHADPSDSSYSEHYCEHCNSEQEDILLIEIIQGARECPDRICSECLKDVCLSCIESIDGLSETDLLTNHL